MTNVAQFKLVLVLMAAIVALELVARRLRMPPAAALILGGIVIALIPGVPGPALDPDLVLVSFLPPLLMASAYFTPWRDIQAELRIVLQLAVGAVLFTTFAVGVTAHWIDPSLPWAACFALGAIVSPPDAVAAKAVLQRVALPRRVTLLLEAESLVNDATGLVLLRFAIAAALTGTFSATEATMSFGILAGGGLVVGVGFGFLASFMLRPLRDPNLAIIGSFLVAWVSYIGAEATGVSGVLSTVACGMVLGWRQHESFSAATRMQADAVWRFVVFMLDSTVFILIGLALRGILERLSHRAGGILPLAPAIAAILAAVILSRFVWLFLGTYMPRFLVPALRRRDPYPPIGIPIVMGWAGMRGVVSLAAALSLPETFPGRDFILVTTFAVILVTVLVQGSTLGPLIRSLHLGDFASALAHATPNMLSESAARARMTVAQLATVERLSGAAEGVGHPRLVEQYGYRARASARFSEAEADLTPRRAAHFAVVLEAVAAGRAAVLRMHRDREIHDSVLHALERDLDLEELAARRLAGEDGVG